MNYLVLKSLHIISIVTWFAGLFYMPRLFIYFAEANQKQEPARTILQDQFKIMQRRLWFGITWPSAIAVLIFGSLLSTNFFPITDHPWFIAKLFFVFGLYVYHFFLHNIYRQQKIDKVLLSSNQLRMINEIATIFLVAIVFLVVLKNIVSMVYGIIGLFIFILVLLLAIKIYKNIREN